MNGKSLTKRDNFSKKTVSILAQRAGQHCSNPECGRSTSGPSDDGSGNSTQLGRAAHITAAASGGPRYDPSLTPKQRSSPDNGIWLCSECADKVDKKENKAAYPVELLNFWKAHHESLTGTDFSTKQNRAYYPIRNLALNGFAGTIGESSFLFSPLTLFWEQAS